MLFWHITCAAAALPPAFVTIGDMGGTALQGHYSFAAASTAAVNKAMAAQIASIQAQFVVNTGAPSAPIAPLALNPRVRFARAESC